MKRIILVVEIFVVPMFCFSQKATIITGTIRNFFPVEYNGKISIPFSNYNPKSEEYKNYKHEYLSKDSFNYKISLDYPELIQFFFKPIYIVPGDSVHIEYYFQDNHGEVKSVFTSIFSKMGFDGNIGYGSFVNTLKDNLRLKLGGLKGSDDFLVISDSLFKDLHGEIQAFISNHRLSNDFDSLIQNDFRLFKFSTQLDYLIHDSSKSFNYIKKHLPLLNDKSYNTLSYFSAIGGVQEAFSLAYPNDPNLALSEMKKYLNGDSFLYASLILANVLRQKLPTSKNPYSEDISLNVLQNTKDEDLIKFANFILNQRKISDESNEQFLKIKVVDHMGKILTIGDALSRVDSKLKYVDLWASWCGPCIEEIPHTLSLSSIFGGETIQPVFISIDTDPAAWKKSEKMLMMNTHRSYLVVNDENLNLVYESLHINAIPHYLLIDSTNKIQLLRAPKAKNISIEFLGPFLSKAGQKSYLPAIPPSPPAKNNK